MDKLEQERRLFEEIGATLERFTREYDMTHAQVLGVMKLIEMDLIDQNKRANQEGD